MAPRRAALAASLLLLAALLPGSCFAAEAVAGLAAAEAAQAQGKEPAEPVISEIIPQAGPAQLARCGAARKAGSKGDVGPRFRLAPRRLAAAQR